MDSNWQAQVRLEDRVVVQIGCGLGERDGCEILAIDGKTYAAIKAALSESNGGILLSERGAVSALPHIEPEGVLTQDERLLAAVECAKTAVDGGAFTAQQAETLARIFDGLGAAIRGDA